MISLDLKTPADVVEALGGPTEFGRICGFDRNPAARGSDMRQRRSIPLQYWPRIVEAAREKSLPIDNDVLVRLHVESGSRPVDPQEGSAAA
jgi:hypothetical protein